MPRFRFRLDPVLRQRQRVVDEVAARLARAQRLVQEQQEHLSVLREAQQAHLDRYSGALAPGELDAAGLRTAVEYAAFLDKAVAEQQARVREMDRRAGQIRELLVEAEKAKRIIENLKARQHAAFFAELADQERRYFDDVANTTFTAKHQTHSLLEGS